MTEVEFDDFTGSLWSGSASCDEESVFSDLSSVEDGDSAFEAAAVFAIKKARSEGTKATLIDSTFPEFYDERECEDDDGRFFFVDIAERFNRFLHKEEGQKPTKAVKFDLERNEEHFDDCFLTEDEALQYWYNKAEIARFSVDARLAAKTLRSSLYVAFNGSVSHQRRTPVTECIVNAYEQCAKCTTNDGMMMIGDLEHRDNLQKIYSQISEVAGLEAVLLRPVRGEPSDLCCYTLESMRDCKARRMRTNGERNDLASVYAKVSQAISRPSRILAQEIGLAFEAALATNEIEASFQNSIKASQK